MSEVDKRRFITGFTLPILKTLNRVAPLPLFTILWTLFLFLVILLLLDFFDCHLIVKELLSPEDNIELHGLRAFLFVDHDNFIE